jgi:acetyl esterase
MRRKFVKIYFMNTYNKTVNPLVKAYLESVPATTPGSIATLRQGLLNIVPRWCGPKTFVPFVEDITADGQLNIRSYSTDKDHTLPALLYFHGGGWVRGNIETHDWLCRNLAVYTGFRIFSVEYSLAPEHTFPAAINDGSAALKWLLAHSNEWKIDPARIAIGGDSSGANIAIATTLKALEKGIRIGAQLLVYPPTNTKCDTGSYQHYAEGFGLTRAIMQNYWNIYLGDPQHADNHFATVLNNDFTAFPPTLIITAECDPLRDDGQQLAEKLQQANVAVQYSMYAGTIHQFFLMNAILPEAQTAQLEAALFLRKTLQ